MNLEKNEGHTAKTNTFGREQFLRLIPNKSKKNVNCSATTIIEIFKDVNNRINWFINPPLVTSQRFSVSKTPLSKKVKTKFVHPAHKVVELLVLSEILPPTGKGDFPIFGRLVIYSVVLIVMSIAESMIVTGIHNKSPDTKMPKSIQLILSSGMMKLLSPKNDENCTQSTAQTQTEFSNIQDAVNYSKSHEMTVSRNKSSLEDKEEAQSVANEWRYLAKVIDRLMFILYFVLLLSGFLYFFIYINI